MARAMGALRGEDRSAWWVRRMRDPPDPRSPGSEVPRRIPRGAFECIRQQKTELSLSLRHPQIEIGNVRVIAQQTAHLRSVAVHDEQPESHPRQGARAPER